MGQGGGDCLSLAQPDCQEALGREWGVCWDSALSSKLPEQGARTPWGQYHFRKPDPGCEDEKEAEIGSRPQPCPSLAV